MSQRFTEKGISDLAAPTSKAQEVYWDAEVHGFGVVVGKTRKTFITNGRRPGERAMVRRTIGAFGQPREDGRLWTVLLARIEARKQLGQLASGTAAPLLAERSERATGPTLNDAMKLHATNMRKKGRAESSVALLESELPRLMADWIDRPIADLTGAELVKVHDKLTADGKGPLANRLVAQVSAVYNALDRVHELPGRNPAKAVTRNAYVPSRKRVDDDGMPEWLAKVEALSPVRHDLQLFCLFTGMRSDAARHVRWEHIDEEAGALKVPKPKGGEKKAFTLPLCKTVLDILEARKTENENLFAQWKGDHDRADHGWVFPTLTRETPHEVVPLAQPREYEKTIAPDGKRQIAIDDDGSRIRALPGLHTLRRTYLSVAAEAGISELDRHVLANHTYGRQNVNATYIEQAFDHLADCQATIEAALWARLKPAPDAKAKQRRARMRSV